MLLNRVKRKANAVTVSELGLAEGANIHLDLVGASLSWDNLADNRQRKCFCLIYEQRGDNDETMVRDIGCTSTKPSIVLVRHSEWHWMCSLQVPANGVLRIEMWEVDLVYGQTMLGQVLLSVGSIAIPLESTHPMFRLPYDLTAPDNEEQRFKDGRLVLQISTDPKKLLVSAQEAQQNRLHPTGSFGQPGVQRVGVLRVKVLQGKALAAESRTGCFVVAKLGDQEHRTEEEDADGEVHNPIWEKSFEFNVFDITQDLRVKVVEAHTIRKDRVVGQVVIPLASLLERWQPKPPCDCWHEILGPVEEAFYNRDGQYRTALKGTRTEGFGLARPEAPVGFLKLGTELVLTSPVPLLYVTPQPGLATRRGRELALAHGKVSIPAIKLSILRIERKFLAFPLWMAEVRQVLRWGKHPGHSLLLLVLHTYIWWFMPLWQLPLVLVLGTVYLGLVTGKRRTFKHVYIYQDEINRAKKGYETIQREMTENYQKAQEIIQKVQHLTEALASLLEKLVNLATWSDWSASCIASAILAAVALAASMMLYIVGGHLREFCYCGGLTLFIPSQLISKARRKGGQAQAHSRTKSVQRPSELIPLSHIDASRHGGSSSAVATAAGPMPTMTGWLYSKDWKRGDRVQLNDLLVGKGGQWERRWCHVYTDPPELHAWQTEEPGGEQSSWEGAADPLLGSPRDHSGAPSPPADESPMTTLDASRHQRPGSPRVSAFSVSEGGADVTDDNADGNKRRSGTWNRLHRRSRGSSRGSASTAGVFPDAPESQSRRGSLQDSSHPGPRRASADLKKVFPQLGASKEASRLGERPEPVPFWKLRTAAGTPLPFLQQLSTDSDALEQSPRHLKAADTVAGALVAAAVTADLRGLGGAAGAALGAPPASAEDLGEGVVIPLGKARCRDTAKKLPISQLTATPDDEADPETTLSSSIIKALDMTGVNGKATMRLFEIRIPDVARGDQLFFLATINKGQRKLWVKAIEDARWASRQKGGSPTPAPIEGLERAVSDHLPGPSGLIAKKLGKSVSLQPNLKDVSVDDTLAAQLEGLASPKAPGMARKWLDTLKDSLLQLAHTVPDDMDLEHRYICSKQVIPDDEVKTRLPDSVFMSAQEKALGRQMLHRDATVRALAQGVQRLMVEVVGGRNLPVKEFQSVVGPLQRKATMWAVLYLSSPEACPMKFKSSPKHVRADPIWKEEFVFQPIKSTEGQLCIQIRAKKAEIGQDKDRLIGTASAPLSQFLDKDVHEMSLTLVKEPAEPTSMFDRLKQSLSSGSQGGLEEQEGDDAACIQLIVNLC